MQKPLPSRALELVVALLTAAVFTLSALATVAAPAPASATSGAAATAAGGASGARHRPAPPAWPFAAMDIPADRPTGSGVRVAVVDSGLDFEHPAFAGRVVSAVDCVDSDGDPSGCRKGVRDDNGHGTHIAGIVAAAPVDGGPEGVAPEAEILAVRVLKNVCEDDGRDEECRALGQLGDVVAGVRWATKNHADVINLSIDAGVDLDWHDGDLADAVSEAWSAGAVVVASTGNRATTIDDPDLENVPLVLVGAIGPDGQRTSYSNQAATARWMLMAPGGEAGGACPEDGVLSTYPTEIAAAGTGCLSGTSMAAAYVSGALASLISSGLDPHAALSQLLATAAPTTDGDLVDLDAALSTPAGGPDADFTAGIETADETGSVQGTDAVFSAGLPLEEWTRVHPVRTRAAGLLSVAAGLLLVTARRRRSPLVGF